MAYNLDFDTALKVNEILDKHLTISATGRHLLSTKYHRQIAIMCGGNYDALNKFQKEIFRALCTNGDMKTFSYFLDL